MPTANTTPRALAPWRAQLETRGGLKLNVRPAVHDDEAELIGFLRQNSPEDLRFRFLTSVKSPGHVLAQPMVAVDHERTENLLAFDARDGSLVATAMVAADDKYEDAEVAVMVRPDLKGQGAGWSMLAHSCEYARERGYQSIHSVELADNHRAIALERDMGFVAAPCPGDPALVILSKDL